MKILKLFLVAVVVFSSWFAWAGDSNVVRNNPWPKAYNKGAVIAWALQQTTEAYACVNGSDVEYTEQRFYKDEGDIDCSGLIMKIMASPQQVISSSPATAQVGTVVAFYGTFGETFIGYNECVKLEQFDGGQWIVPESLRNVALKLPDILWVPVDVQGDIQYATVKTRDDNGNIKGWTQLQTQKAGSTTLVGLPTKLLDKKGELQVGSTYYDGTGYHYTTRSYNLQDQGDTGEVVTNPARNITVEDVVETTDNDQWTWYADTGGTGIGDMPLFQHTLTKTTDVLIGAGCDVGSLPKTVYIRRIKPTQTDWIPIPLDGDGKYRNTFDSGRYQLYFEGFLNGPGPDWVDPYWLYSDGEKG